VIKNLTGTPIEASIFLFHIGVVAYTLFGGIKATFKTDYINGLVIIVIVFMFAFTVYGSHEVLGSPGRVWDILTELAATQPLEGNAGGSYLTMRSQGGGMPSLPRFPSIPRPQNILHNTSPRASSSPPQQSPSSAARARSPPSSSPSWPSCRRTPQN